MDIYRELGVTPVINAAGSLTSYGGSIMPPEVTDAMARASRAFVDMQELHLAAGARIAELIGVEAAHVCACASAGIAVMAAACMAGTDRERIRQLPDTTGMRNRFIVQRAHRNGFDQAVRVAGGELIEIDSDDGQLAQELENPQTAAVYYTFAWFCPRDALSLQQVAEMSHAKGLPVIVDAAAEVPPPINLRRFLDWGADLVTFSGGKSLRGPQSSGLILGRAELIEACRLNDCPNGSIGRPMKTDKEVIAGLVKAVELYMAKDHDLELAMWDDRVAHIITALDGLDGVRAWRQMPHGIGQQISHAAVSWDEAALGLTHEQAAQALRDGDPRIVVQVINTPRYGFAGFTEKELRVHPHALQEGEERIVARRLREVLTGSVT